MIIKRRSFLTLTGAAVLSLLVGTSTVEAKIVSTEEALTELVYGNADAPVEVIEYASLACPHCRSFHEEIFPALKEAYIDTGKIKFIFRDFPTNSPALAAAMIARCAGPERHAGMIDIFFQTQPQWGRSENPLQALTMVSRMAGISPSEVDTCLKNSDLMNGINGGAQQANEKMDVRATPTIFVAGEKVEPTNDLEKIKAAIENALADAQ